MAAPDELDEAALEAKLFPAPTSEPATRSVPDWTAVHRELKRGRHVTLRLHQGHARPPQLPMHVVPVG